MEKIHEKVLEIEKSILEKIDVCMDAYSENGDLYEEFGIEEDSYLYSFYTEFDNGYTYALHVNSGKSNCYIDHLLYNSSGRCLDYLMDEGGLSDNDVIEFYLNDEKYFVKIKAI